MPWNPDDGLIFTVSLNPADDGRLAGLYRDAVHQNARFSQRVDGLDRIVAKAHGASARDEHDIRATDRLMEAFFDDCEIVGEDVFGLGLPSRLDHPRRK